jgi:tetraacyldisaccharide 4'-kinase
VDVVVAHGSAVTGYAMKLEGEEVHRMTDARERRPLKAFAGQEVHAVAGIGDPDRFFLHVGRAGVKVIPHPFPDHHPFGERDLDFGDERPVLLTEKDAVKLRGAARPDWWVLPVSARVDPGFGAWLLRKLDECRRS